MNSQVEVKYCQSCIERGYNPPRQATREWQTGIYYCDDCFNAIIENLTNIAPAEFSSSNSKPTNDSPALHGPILDSIYEKLNIPVELQFDRVDTVCRNHEKFFNFAAPAVINKTIEELSRDIEEMAMSMFVIKYVQEPLTLQINKLKEERRKEKGLVSIDDSRETYSKPRKGSQIKENQEEKMAKILNMTIEDYKIFMEVSKIKEKKKKEGDFNEIVGNCRCGLARLHTEVCEYNKPQV